MPIFYILHTLSPNTKGTDLNEGQRNSRIFLIGMFLYVLAYIVLKNLVISGKLDSDLFDAMFVGLLIMFCADGFTMGFTYKNYFGRSITNEAKEIWGDGEKDHIYDEKTHKFTKINKVTNDNDSKKSAKSVKSAKIKAENENI